MLLVISQQRQISHAKFCFRVIEKFMTCVIK